MAIPRNFIHTTGKENLMASFNHWLMDTVLGGHVGFGALPADKDFYWAFDYPIQPGQNPSISTTEIGLFSLGDNSLDRLLAIDTAGEPIYGYRNQTLIEITILDQDSDSYTGATRKVRNLRDRVHQALQTEIIPFKDYSNPSAPQLGIIQLDNQSNAINEKYIVDPVNQQLKRYTLLIRVFWNELLVRESPSKTITSDSVVV